MSEENNCLDMVVFFSPSGVKFSWDILKQYFSKLPKCIAIGPTTFKCLKTYCTDEHMIYESKYPSAVGIENIVEQVIKELWYIFCWKYYLMSHSLQNN